MPRVLLIEDEQALAEPLLRLIDRAGASVVDWAPSPETAFRLAGFPGYDIVIADFDLGPGQPNGVAVLEQLRENHPGYQTCVVVSGSPRDVPSWCTFFDKTNPSALAELISAWS